MSTPTDDEPPYKPKPMPPEERDAYFARLMKEQNIQPGGWSDMPVEIGDEGTPADDEPWPSPRTLSPEERDALVARLMKEQNVQPGGWDDTDWPEVWETDAEFEEFMEHLRRIRADKE